MMQPDKRQESLCGFYEVDEDYGERRKTGFEGMRMDNGCVGEPEYEYAVGGGGSGHVFELRNEFVMCHRLYKFDGWLLSVLFCAVLCIIHNVLYRLRFCLRCQVPL